MRLYFAYGSNMDEARMVLRCPEAKPIGVARLERHRFFVTSTGWASILPDPDSSVWGLLWTLSEDDEQKLDIYEEVDLGFYTKEQLVVTTLDGEEHSALVYVETSLDPGAPTTEYITWIIDAATRINLPDAYQNVIRSFRKN